MHKSEQTVFKLFSSKSSGIPPSLRYGATLPGLRTRRNSKSEGGFRRQPDNSAARASDRRDVSVAKPRGSSIGWVRGRNRAAHIPLAVTE